MQHERFFAFACKRIDDLRVAARAERRGDERLRLTPRKERRTVRARQYACFDADLAHGVHVAAVDARLAREDAATHDVVLEQAELVGHLAGVVLRRLAAGERLDDGLLDLADASVSR